MKANIPEPVVTLEMSVAEAIEVYDFAFDIYHTTGSQVMGLLQAELGAALEDAGVFDGPDVSEEAFGLHVVSAVEEDDEDEEW